MRGRLLACCWVLGCGGDTTSTDGNDETATSADVTSSEAETNASEASGEGDTETDSETDESSTDAGSEESTDESDTTESGAGDTSFPSLPEGSRIVFVSSGQGGAVMGGVLGADENCQALADSADLPGTYVAWISGTLEPVTDRIDMLGGPFVRPDGEVVALDWGDLTDGTLENPISVDESGVDRIDGPGLDVWTSTHHDGSRDTAQPTSTCKSWTSPEDPDAGLGNLSRTDSGWSFSTVGPCQSNARLYCIGSPI